MQRLVKAIGEVAWNARKFKFRDFEKLVKESAADWAALAEETEREYKAVIEERDRHPPGSNPWNFCHRASRKLQSKMRDFELQAESILERLIAHREKRARARAREEAQRVETTEADPMTQRLMQRQAQNRG